MRGIFLNTSPHKINAWEGGNGASGSGAMKMSKFFSKDYSHPPANDTLKP